nr:hypothetical protein [Tanacetum cinerariifolium]
MNYGLEDGRISCARVHVSGGGGVGTASGGALLFNSLSKTLSDVNFFMKRGTSLSTGDSPGALTTPIYSSGSSSTPIYSPGSSTPPRYSP